MSVAEALPARRREIEGFLARQAAGWGPGRTFIAPAHGSIAAVARLLEPNPGDGHHREHAREVVVAGDEAAFGELALEAARVAGETMRLEATVVDGDEALLHAWRAAGLELEARLPGGWMSDAGLRDWLWLGRPARRGATAGSRPAAEGAPRAIPAGAREGSPPDPAAKRAMRWFEPDLGPALERFLASLVPGRAYPAGTLLSEAERLETRRRDVSRAAWLLALDAAGEVAGGLMMEPQREAARAHVRRVHLDVRPPARGLGVASGLVARALAECGRFGVRRLEADPRALNAGACRALERGGMLRVGLQRGAWRVRGLAGTRDEDVAVYSAPSGASSGTSGASGVGSLA